MMMRLGWIRAFIIYNTSIVYDGRSFTDWPSSCVDFFQYHFDLLAP